MKFKNLSGRPALFEHASINQMMSREIPSSIELPKHVLHIHMAGCVACCYLLIKKIRYQNLIIITTSHHQLEATMKLSTTFAILFGAAFAAVTGVVSAEVS